MFELCFMRDICITFHLDISSYMYIYFKRYHKGKPRDRRLDCINLTSTIMLMTKEASQIKIHFHQYKKLDEIHTLNYNSCK